MADDFPWQRVFAALLIILFFLDQGFALKPGYVKGIVEGKEYLVRDDRQPSLYTGNFGDCAGDSSINVTRFDAAYYQDNMTIVFHLGGDSAFKNETIMIYMGVYAYGEPRFALTFDPCKANIESACPVRSSVSIEAGGVIPVGEKDVAQIPVLALEVPDFEGQVILRLFSNNTRSQIGCYSAVLTNGNTFSHPVWVGSILGGFTGIAALSSLVTAAYGNDAVEIRKHNAHSISVGVVFAVWHHIYYSGALSMNWPGVLVSFWSNYAWTGGMIYSEHMQNTINNFIGANKGNISAAGAASSGVGKYRVGGGYNIHQIYNKRELQDSTTGFSWYGDPVRPGLPLPGNHSSFAGTLAVQKIPASNAFLTGFLWFLVFLGMVAVSIVALKLFLEIAGKIRIIKRSRLAYFRAHYLAYILLAMLRTVFMGFFMLTFLTLFEFFYLNSARPVAIACTVFLILLVGVGGLAVYACCYGIRSKGRMLEPDRLHIVKRTILGVLPWCSFERNSKFTRSEDKRYAGSLPWWNIRSLCDDSNKSVHEDETFVKRFGWLASRYRRNRWWFFALWLAYEFVRASFLASASGQPMVQVLGLLAVEVVGFIGMTILRPFEGQRLNVIVAYLIGLSKVVTTSLSAALCQQFNLARIPATIVAIVIIAIQGVLTIVVLVAIVIGVLTSYLSVTRDRETIHPKDWDRLRTRFFEHVERTASEKSCPKSPRKENQVSAKALAVPRDSYFTVNSIRRVPKVEDEDIQFIKEIQGDFSSSQQSLFKHNHCGRNGTPYGRSMTSSLHSQVSLSLSTLPLGARVHRVSWNPQVLFGTAVDPSQILDQATANTPGADIRRWRNTVPSSSTLVGRSSQDVSRHHIPVTGSQETTPENSPSSRYSSSGPIPRPKSRRSDKSPDEKRQVRIVTEEQEIQCLPETPDRRAIATPTDSKRV